MPLPVTKVLMPCRHCGGAESANFVVEERRAYLAFPRPEGDDAFDTEPEIYYSERVLVCVQCRGVELVLGRAV